MDRCTDGYPPHMSENVEHPTGAQGDPAENQDPSTQDDPAVHQEPQDSDADPEMMNPRDLTGEGSGESDPDLDPDSLNPRGEA